MGPELNTRSAQLPVLAMRLQLSAACTLCSAENALALGRVQNAREAIANARRTAGWVRLHLDEPTMYQRIQSQALLAD